MYRNTLGIDSNQTFGIEIEFENIRLSKLYTELIDNYVDVSYIINHKAFFYDYLCWYLDVDSTVTEIVDNDIIGGELSSRILNDNIKTWQEIKKICRILNNYELTKKDNSSLHITIDISHINNYNDLLRILYKIICIYEVELNIFYMGDNFFIRKTKDEYAKNLSIKLLNYIDIIDWNNILPSLYKYNIFVKTDAVNLNKLEKDNLIEIRYPNASYNEETIQNNINFTVKLFNSIKDQKFDEEYFDWKISNYKKDSYYSYHVSNYIDSLEQFMELTGVISTSSIDNENFYNQYIKVINTR